MPDQIYSFWPLTISEDSNAYSSANAILRLGSCQIIWFIGEEFYKIEVFVCHDLQALCVWRIRNQEEIVEQINSETGG